LLDAKFKVAEEVRIRHFERGQKIEEARRPVNALRRKLQWAGIDSRARSTPWSFLPRKTKALSAALCGARDDLGEPRHLWLGICIFMAKIRHIILITLIHLERRNRDE
jgi:hypothetical protein